MFKQISDCDKKAKKKEIYSKFRDNILDRNDLFCSCDLYGSTCMFCEMALLQNQKIDIKILYLIIG